MTSPQLTIARVSFSAVLLRPGPTPCPRSEIDDFLGQLDATITRCSPANVQKSKHWILSHIVRSPPRVAALGKYLTSLASSYTEDLATTRQTRETSSKRKRLHILYVVNDVIHHVLRQQPGSTLPSQLEPIIPLLIQSTSAYAQCPKHISKVSGLVDLWEEHGFFPPAFAAKLRETIRDAPTSNTVATSAASNGVVSKLPKDAPFIMPAMHGDANVPWYDLPAANWLPVIEPNSTRAMNPSMIKPLKFMPGPADKGLVKAVQDLLEDVERIYAKDRGLNGGLTEDIDQLGQRVVVDEITKDVVRGETYYGWSRKFCEKMKQRRKKGNNGRGHSQSRSRSRSRNSSRSRSRPAFKRRRTSDSRSPHSRSRTRSRSRIRRRSYSSDRQHSRSGSSSRSGSPRRDHRFQRSRSRSHARSRDYSPPPPSKSLNDSSGSTQPYPGYNNSQPHFPPPPHNIALPFGGTPPPAPPNWQGSWPPPPPPPPPATGMPPNWMSNIPPPLSGGWRAAPVPPPPPPPVAQFDSHQQSFQGGQSQYGHGGRGDYRGGRGGWRGNRGGW